MSARLRIMPSGDEGTPPPAEDAATGADDLTGAALSGDAAAWSALIARHGHKVLVALLARGVPLERAREVTQETWLRLMERQRQGRLTELSLPGLAIVQAGFLASNERRRSGRQLPAAAAPEPATGRTGEDEVLGKERVRRMARALDACPAGARRVFELVYDHPELGYAEVAARVGLSVQRVKQIVFEVRKRLRAALDEDAP
jgi:RNA polymerase sigma factor (sigma-70 family)